MKNENDFEIEEFYITAVYIDPLSWFQVIISLFC